MIQGYPDYEFTDAEIEDLLRERVKQIIPEETEPVLFEGEAEHPSAPRAPVRMKLKGKSFDLNNSFEILVNTANWLIDQGKLRAADCPVSIGGVKRYLINREPKHKNGDNFRAPKKLSNGLWIEAHASTAAAIAYSQRLLEKFGVLGTSLILET